MTHHRQNFDWTAWYAKIPGIPADWGFRKDDDQVAPRRETIVPRRRRLHLAR